jgi:hypothetical protein
MQVIVDGGNCGYEKADSEAGPEARRDYGRLARQCGSSAGWMDRVVPVVPQARQLELSMARVTIWSATARSRSPALQQTLHSAATLELDRVCHQRANESLVGGYGSDAERGGLAMGQAGLTFKSLDVKMLPLGRFSAVPGWTVQPQILAVQDVRSKPRQGVDPGAAGGAAVLAQ